MKTQAPGYNPPYHSPYADSPQVAVPSTPALEELSVKLRETAELVDAVDERLARALTRAFGHGPHDPERDRVEATGTLSAALPKVDSLFSQANYVNSKLGSIAENLNRLDTLV